MTKFLNTFYIGKNKVEINKNDINKINEHFYNLYMQFMNPDSPYSIDSMLRRYVSAVIDEKCVDYQIVRTAVSLTEAKLLGKTHEYVWTLHIKTPNEIIKKPIRLFGIPIPDLDYNFCIYGKKKLAIHRLIGQKMIIYKINNVFVIRAFTNTGWIRISGSFQPGNNPVLRCYCPQEKGMKDFNLRGRSNKFKYDPYNGPEAVSEDQGLLPELVLPTQTAYFWSKFVNKKRGNDILVNEFMGDMKIGLEDIVNMINEIYITDDNLLTKDSLFNKKIVTPVHSIYSKLHALEVYTKLYKAPLGKNQMHKIKIYILKFIESFKTSINIDLFSTSEGYNALNEAILKLKLYQLSPEELGLTNVGLNIRGYQNTFIGRICSTETPESNKIGLNIALLPTVKFDMWGDIYMSVFDIDQNKIVDLDVYEQREGVITDTRTWSESHVDLISVVTLDRGIVDGKTKDVSYIFANENTLVSLALQQVPFVGYCSNSRMLVTASQIRQSLALEKNELPYVLTTELAGKSTDSNVYVDKNHKISHRDGKIKISTNKSIDNYTSKVVYSDSEYTPFGTNLFVGYGTFYGYTYEDSCVLNKKIIDDGKLNSTHSTRFSIPIYNTKYGAEILTDDLLFMHKGIENITTNGLIKVNSKVGTGDILLGKITPMDVKESKRKKTIYHNPHTALSDSSVLCNIPSLKDGVVTNVRIINQAKDNKEWNEYFNKRAEEITEEYVKVYANVIRFYLKGDVYEEGGNKYSIEEVIIDFKADKKFTNLHDLYSIMDEKREEELCILKYNKYTPSVNKDQSVIYVVEIDISYSRNIIAGDKISNRYGSKSIVSAIVDDAEMPFTECGRRLDLILSPTNLLGRLGIGQLLEIRYGLLIYYIKKEVNEIIERYDEVKAQALHNKLVKYFEIGGYAKEDFLNFDPRFVISQFDVYDSNVAEEMKNEFIPNKSWTQKLFLPRSNTSTLNGVGVGYSYIIKLVQTGQAGISHRAIGGYSTITQQPIKGNVKIDQPQRFGEMENFCLRSWNVPKTLQELMTVSDNIVNRQVLYKNLVNKGESKLPTSLSTSFQLIKDYLLVMGIKLQLKHEMEESHISIKVATREEMEAASKGYVQLPDTMNYRTLQPTKGGLFCETIFGSLSNLKCRCGKFKGKEFKGIVCDVCGVKVDYNTGRRTNFGMIKLHIPIFNLSLGLQHVSSLLRLPRNKILDVVNEVCYIYHDSGTNRFIANVNRPSAISYIGSEGLYDLFSDHGVKNCINYAPEDQREALASLFENLDVKNLFINELLVLPPDLRPMLMSPSSFICHEFNTYYRLVMFRNNRLINMDEYGTPYKLMKEDRVGLVASINNLIWNGKFYNPYKEGRNEIPSIMTIFKGKKGILRKDITGKNIDYSARAVLVADPNLPFNYCTIPIEIGIKIFEPLIIRYIMRHSDQVYDNKRYMLEDNPDLVLEALDEISLNRKVLINRAPTLHTLSIQAFKPIFTRGVTLGLAPSVFKAFNADCDGDKLLILATHSNESQKEISEIMYLNNVINPVDNSLIVNFKKETKVGIYLAFRDIHKDDEYVELDDRDLLSLNAKTLNKRVYTYFNGKRYETTLGKLHFYNTIRKAVDVEFEIVDKLDQKDNLSTFLKNLYLKDKYKFPDVLTDLQKLSFEISTIFGLSINFDDIEEFVNLDLQKELNDKVSKILNDGEVEKIPATYTEYENKFVQYIKTKDLYFNNIYNTFKSGARGNENLIKVVSNLVGRFFDFFGEQLSTTVINNYSKGLTLTQYILASSGNRRGLATRALTTAEAGFFTRKMYLLCMNENISADDCGTPHSIEVDLVKEGIGTAINRYSGKPIELANKAYPVNTIFTEEILREIAKEKSFVHVRSPLMCLNSETCKKCYGVNSKGEDYKVRDNVGILSSYGITEPSMQGFMDQFKSGGLVESDLVNTSFKVDSPSIVKYINIHIVKDTNGREINIGKHAMVELKTIEGGNKRYFNIEPNSYVMVKDGEEVSGTFIAYQNTNYYFSPCTGVVKLYKHAIVINNDYIYYSQEKLLIKDGDSVKQGDPLFRCNNTIGKWSMKDLGQFLGNTAPEHRILPFCDGTVHLSMNPGESSMVNVKIVSDQDKNIKQYKVGIKNLAVFNGQRVGKYTPINMAKGINVEELLYNDIKSIRYISMIFKSILMDVDILTNARNMDLVLKRLIVINSNNKQESFGFHYNKKLKETKSECAEEAKEKVNDIILFKGITQTQRFNLDGSFFDMAVLSNAPKNLIEAALKNSISKIGASFVNQLITGIF